MRILDQFRLDGHDAVVTGGGRGIVMRHRLGACRCCLTRLIFLRI